MSQPGEDEVVEIRRALLDALQALTAHRGAVVLIGAQGIYLHTGRAPVALAEMTRDSDLALDARLLAPEPLIEKAMAAGGFHLDPESGQPGSWLSRRGFPVDLMVPAAQGGQGGRRGGRIPPHAKRATRKATGLEAAVVDNSPTEIAALDAADTRRFTVRVAGPAALLVAKLHKLGERDAEPNRLRRLHDKDAHDIYRLLVAIPTAELADAIIRLRADALSGPVTEAALGYLRELFGAGPQALGSSMAGRAEEGIGDPQTVAASAAFLASDLLAAIERAPRLDGD